MAKWYWFIVQPQGEMPRHIGPFSNVETLSLVADDLMATGTHREDIYPVIWEDSERVINMDNLADLTDEELRQL